MNAVSPESSFNLFSFSSLSVAYDLPCDLLFLPLSMCVRAYVCVCVGVWLVGCMGVALDTIFFNYHFHMLNCSFFLLSQMMQLRVPALL